VQAPFLSVSHQIKALEEALGVRHFIRRTRAVDLGPEAARALPVLTEALDQIEAAMLDVAESDMTGALAISVGPFYGTRFLLPRLEQFHAAHPGLVVHPRLSFAQEDLSREGLDGGGAVRHGRLAGAGQPADPPRSRRPGLRAPDGRGCIAADGSRRDPVPASGDHPAMAGRVVGLVRVLGRSH